MCGSVSCEFAEWDPGSESGEVWRAPHEEPAYATPLTSPGFEELEHAFVGAPGLARERVGHNVLEPVVTDTDRVGIPECEHRHAVQGPRSDARQCQEAAADLADSDPRRVGESMGVGRCHLDGRGASAFDAPAVEGP